MAFVTYGQPSTFTFDWGLPTVPTKEEQTGKLREMALDNLAKELDDLSARASRAAGQMRQLRPMLPTREQPARNETGKRRKR
jgi:hypothetical protein